ncbi:ATP-dependent helicase [Corynebacterium glaucum]
MADMQHGIGPVALSRALGQAHQPTPQQADVIGAPPGPLLVVAGAGAGKTETMAARVVWLVANGYARPDEILGLTFTRKAAQELGKRIRDRLGVLASDEALVRRLDPSGELTSSLRVIAPTVSTYDAYAGDLIREYGLLVPVEPDARLITEAELHAIATEVVLDYRGSLISENGTNPAVNSVVENLLGLITSMGNELASAEDVIERAEIFLKETESLEPSKRTESGYSQTMLKWRSRQEERTAYLPLAAALNTELRRRGLVTFNEQMSVAAKLARDHASVGERQRQRFRVIMLDEYQDTSHAQRVLLRSLFGEGTDPKLTVTAVGDPMQAIYGWRGATAANLAAFVEDFPASDGSPAPKKQLTTSWRNPPEILDLANSVSDAILGTGAERAVAQLEPRPGAGAGSVHLGFFEHEDDEVAYVAGELETQFTQAKQDDEPFTAAVLVRKNKHSSAIAEALEARGVPYEIVGVAGLLDVPEVADTVAIATMLVRPGDSAAALRILGGPAVGLGLADLQALAVRATNLAGRGQARSADAERGDFDEAARTPEAHLEAQLAELVQRAEEIVGTGERAAGLADAVADLGEPERYSATGLQRLRELSAKLRWLRTNSLGKQLTDVFADIISVFGIRAEVLSRPTASRAAHLDRLLHEVAQYPGTSLTGLLDYFELARTHEDGLAPGNVTVKDDRVQIMTAHKAKGLEWDTVAVLHADDRTYSDTAETFLGIVKRLQDESFGDPELTPEFGEVETRPQFEKAVKAWLKTVRGDFAEETARLFYVAITRSERKLIVTASSNAAGSTKQTGPYTHFEKLASLVRPADIVQWHTDGDAEGDDEGGSAERPDGEREGRWPNLHQQPHDQRAAQTVTAARASLPPLVEGELYGLWERDATALIEEHAASLSPEVAVVVPGELTASDVVAMRADPAQFARRARRPVPYKPNAYAKRGTAFHQWLEEFYGARPLIDEDELPGNDEAEVDRATLEQLKRSFEASHWASRTPAFVEHPFELAMGNAMVRGRIDAVFEDETGWIVVDWKTGQKPGTAEMESAKLQLAVYREAWRRIAADGRDVRAVFFYLRTGEDYAPDQLPAGQDLADMLAPRTQQEGRK